MLNQTSVSASIGANRAPAFGLTAAPASRRPALAKCSILQVPDPVNGAPDWCARQTKFRLLAPFDRAHPDLDAWALGIAQAAARLPAPAVVLAHGSGCLATIAAAQLQPRSIAGVMLVEPADPAQFGLRERLWHLTLPCPGVLVLGQSDSGVERAGSWPESWMWALRWETQFACTDLGDTRNRHGACDNGLELLEQLCRRVLRRD